jgi:hypothetical protein
VVVLSQPPAKIYFCWRLSYTDRQRKWIFAGGCVKTTASENQNHAATLAASENQNHAATLAASEEEI